MKLNIDKSTWRKVKLGDVAIEYSNRIQNPSESGLERFIGSKNIGQWDFRLQSWESTDSVTSVMKIFEPKDYLLVRRSLYASDFRERAPRANFKGVCSGDILTIRENPKFIADGFLIVILNHPDIWKFIVANASGSITRRIKWSDLAKYEFLLPPLDQQKQLAKLLWAMDEVIEKEKEVREELDRYYLSLIEKKIINRNSPKLYFEELVDVIRGVNYKPKNLLDTEDENTCVVLRSNNIYESEINYDDIKILPKEYIKEEQFMEKGDFAICMSNGSKDLVGKAAEFIDENKTVSVGSFCAILRPKTDLAKQLVRHLISSESYRIAIQRIISGSTINNLKPDDINNLFLRIDKEKVEKNVLDNLNEIVENKRIIDSKIHSSEQLLRSLIHQIF